TLFPYTTLFRSREVAEDVEVLLVVEDLIPERAEHREAQVPGAPPQREIQARGEIRMGTPDDREVGRRDPAVAVRIAELEATGRFARLIPDAGIASRGGLGRCVERRDLRRAVEVPVRLVAIERPD